jgi:serine/threonine protein kinase
VWRQLDHPHILPFIGVMAWPVTNAMHHCLVSPWMANGSLQEFMRSDQFDSYLDGPRFVGYLVIVTRSTFLIGWRKQLFEVSEGLIYLHSQKVVHGDLNDVGISSVHAFHFLTGSLFAVEHLH